MNQNYSTNPQHGDSLFKKINMKDKKQVVIQLPTPHKAQQVILNDDSRLQIIETSRRFGKDVLIRHKIVNAVLKEKKNVVYIAPASFLIREMYNDLVRLFTKDILMDDDNDEFMYIHLVNGQTIRFINGEILNEIKDYTKLKCDLLVVNEFVDAGKLMLFMEKNNRDVLFIGTGITYGIYNFFKYRKGWSYHSYSTEDNPYLYNEEPKPLRELINSNAPADRGQKSKEEIEWENNYTYYWGWEKELNESLRKTLVEFGLVYNPILEIEKYKKIKEAVCKLRVQKKADRLNKSIKEILLEEFSKQICLEIAKENGQFNIEVLKFEFKEDFHLNVEIEFIYTVSEGESNNGK